MEESQCGYTRASSLYRDIHLAFIRLVQLGYRSRFVEAGISPKRPVNFQYKRNYPGWRRAESVRYTALLVHENIIVVNKIFSTDFDLKSTL
jgi:hypothetical protein